MRPAPQHLTFVQFGKVLGLWLREKDDIALVEELFLGAHSGEEVVKLLGPGAETAPVAIFQED
jgi:hypothetical protein